MSWIDDSRRDEFENHQRVSTQRRGRPARDSGAVGELDRSLPGDIRERALRIGNELILSYEDALTAITFATEHQIAILGFDSGEVLGDSLHILDYTGYDRDIPFAGDWKAFVAAMNVEAERWTMAHRLGKNHGYVLTSTSEREFAKLQP